MATHNPKEVVAELSCKLCGTNRLNIHRHEDGEIHVTCPIDRDITIFVHACKSERKVAN